MTGWLIILSLAVAIAAALWRFADFRGPALQFLAAALLLAMAGYAWQGQPGLPGSPVAAQVRPERPETAFASLRDVFFPRFTSASRWLIIADSYQRRGNSEDAVGVIRAGLRSSPDNFVLWIGLGNALVQHGGGAMSPAADHAYRRAETIVPGHPATRFFYGMNLIQSGRIDEAEAIWRELLATAPPGGAWRPMVEQRLAILERIRAMRGSGPPAG